jgi:hypothetical protein
MAVNGRFEKQEGITEHENSQGIDDVCFALN